MPFDGEREKDFWWYSLMYKARWVLETELPVIVRLSHNAASRRIQILKTGQPFLYQGFADAVAMLFWGH